MEYERTMDRKAKIRSVIHFLKPCRFPTVGWDVLINMSHCDGEWVMDSVPSTFCILTFLSSSSLTLWNFPLGYSSFSEIIFRDLVVLG